MTVKVIPSEARLYPRATGRTFRRVLNALVKASSGSHVFYISPDRRSSEHANKRALRIVADHTRCEVNGDYRKIEFPQGGTLQFVTQEEMKNRDLTRGFSTMKMELINDDY